MRAYLKTLVAVGAITAGAGGAAAQTQGDWVLARYKGGEHYYPGIVQGMSGDRIAVAYDDGDRETLSVALIKPYNWAIGGRVECNFQGSGKWYLGVIASLAGESIGVNYDDGDKERTKTGRCRSR